MKVRSKVAAGTIAMALAAMISGGRPALAQSSKPSILASAPPTYLIAARGFSVDGSFNNTLSGCSFCTNLSYCGCFTTDADNGGSGFFQFSNSAQTPLTWTIELDYNSDPANEILTTDSDAICIPTSGFGTGSELSGRKVNTFDFETTGLICDTANNFGTFTGSYIMDGGTGNYSNATGSGSLTIGIAANESETGLFENQIQFTGNLAQ
ncbi:MAG TPA: hypothetical protein VMU41_05760 [Candidatus Binataceae bacterium]|nr:hypothetical protein [Candidatus Binataceae bacterium]